MLPKNLLCIEACTDRLTLALYSDGELKAFAEPEPGAKHHCETLVPSIDALLADDNLKPGDIDAVAVTRGPGSFTSVRIALATALGLARPRKLPLYAVSTLETLAAGVREEECLVLPLLDARKGEVYGAMYRIVGGIPQLSLPECVTPIDEMLEAAASKVCCEYISVIGDGALVYRDDIRRQTRFLIAEGSEIHRPDAAALGRVVLHRLAHGLPFDEATPNYLRQPEAVVNLGRTPEGLH